MAVFRSLHLMGTFPPRPPGGTLRGGCGQVGRAGACLCEPLLPSLLAAENTQHRAAVDSKGPGSIRMHLPARIYYRKDFVFRI